MGLTAATGQGSGDVASWFEQFGQSGTGTIQGSWDQNSGVRNANIELLNRLISLGTAFADLTNSSNAITLGDLSGANRSTRYKHGGEGDDRPMANFCGGEKDLSWSDAAKGCVQGVDAHAELLIRPQ
jgi:hypothetical protein